MGFNWSGFVVRAGDEAALSRVREVDARALVLPGGYARVGWNSGVDWTRAGSTRRWSEKLGEAWYFEAASVSDVFAYEHGRDGEVLRALGYDGSEGWALVEGEAEPWEASALFSPRGLVAAEEMARDEPDEPRWAREIDDLKAGRLRVGNLFPQADATLALLIAEGLGTELLR